MCECVKWKINSNKSQRQYGVSQYLFISRAFSLLLSFISSFHLNGVVSPRLMYSNFAFSADIVSIVTMCTVFRIRFDRTLIALKCNTNNLRPFKGELNNANIQSYRIGEHQRRQTMHTHIDTNKRNERKWRLNWMPRDKGVSRNQWLILFATSWNAVNTYSFMTRLEPRDKQHLFVGVMRLNPLFMLSKRKLTAYQFNELYDVPRPKFIVWKPFVGRNEQNSQCDIRCMLRRTLDDNSMLVQTIWLAIRHITA